MSGIQAVIFSHNRAAQLDLLLRSIERYAPGVFDLTVTYNYSASEFERGYDILREERPGKWIPQGDLYNTPQFKGLVGTMIGDGADDGYTCFFCDDDVIYRPITSEIVELITPDVMCFSLRLGVNTTRSYMLNRPNLLHSYESRGQYIEWDWTAHDADNHYPLSLNGHVFRTELIADLIGQIEFTSVNTLEDHLKPKGRGLPRRMAAYKKSRLVNVPANRIQDEYPNLYGLRYPKSAEGLNTAFLEGERIDLEAMDFSNVWGCCQELKLPMRRLGGL